MAFRKRLTALAVLVLALGLITTASAQGPAFQCTANAGVPPLARGEGLTELVGDIVLNCTGGTPTPVGTSIPQANISIFLNTAVTSRLIGSASEALLMIDEPTTTLSSTQMNICGSTTGCTTVGAGGGSGTFKASGVANTFQGVVSGNSVTFIGIPVEPPGSVGTRIYRITNVRANASALFTGAAVPNQIVALISATPATGPTGLTSSFPINNPQQIVGFVQQGLNFDVRDINNKNTVTVDVAAGVFAQCQDQKSSSGAGVLLRYQEGFATAFRPRTIAAPASADASPAPASQATPGLIYNSESGLYNPLAFGASTLVGLADFGTRLKATFSNIPAGVNLWVSTTNTSASGANLAFTNASFARLVGAETGAFFPLAKTDTLASTDVYSVPLTNGGGTVVWEVLSSQPLVQESFLFRVILAYSASPATNSPATGSALVAGSFAPTPPAFSASDGAKASATLPIPRFIDTGKGINFFRIAQCRSILLFPFVTNQAGFDTGLAISNTTTDPFGTAAQNGSCDLSFYGANAPAVVNTGTIASGTTYAAVASTIAPNFQGYVFAVCGFQMGHGFAFVSDIGARNLAMGYLALVVPDGVSRPSGVTLQGAGTGELLGQ
ncbi:MAG: hypothetical protein M1436_02235 [Acidobacteria bacterium]|nr:hypothetical protein [Acidobacteriota bacterium]